MYQLSNILITAFFPEGVELCFLRVKQNHREDGTKAACLVEEACLHSIGRGWGAVPASREGMGIRGDREGVLTPGMLTPDSVEIVSSADREQQAICSLFWM